MHLDATAAKALAAIIMVGMQSPDDLYRQLPLQTVDRGSSWLVKGTPYTDVRRSLQFCFSHVILRKDNAEVVALGTDVRQMLTDAETKHWHQMMSNEQFDRIFGLRTHFEEGGEYLERNLMMNAVLNGGLINTPQNAIAYARVIMKESPHLAGLAERPLNAQESKEIWHVSVSDAASGRPIEMMSFSRRNGKVLSGDP